ncbi:MAG TPA: KGG domain-containing protein [Steroidobacteraceae bacterium]|jgi:general stress protein YciG|nr:KGG domain-containing protein [Steroidobacteraceae bacterium]
MPNNNPQGHNQYTKRREPMQPSATAAEGPLSDLTTGEREAIDTTSTASPDTTIPSTSGASQGPAKRGFAAMDEATQRTIASKGGQSQGKENNPGNFANDRDRAREAGRKGGEAHGHRQP